MPYEDKDLLPPTLEEHISAIFGVFELATVDESKVVCLAVQIGDDEAQTFLRRLRECVVKRTSGVT